MNDKPNPFTFWLGGIAALSVMGCVFLFTHLWSKWTAPAPAPAAAVAPAEKRICYMDTGAWSPDGKGGLSVQANCLPGWKGNVLHLDGNDATVWGLMCCPSPEPIAAAKPPEPKAPEPPKARK